MRIRPDYNMYLAANLGSLADQSTAFLSIDENSERQGTETQLKSVFESNATVYRYGHIITKK